MSQTGWVGVDLDRTLAHYDRWQGHTHIGEPVPAMLDRVKKWLSEGQDVRIFTARVSHDGTEKRYAEASEALVAVEQWCLKHLGKILPVTCIKDYNCIEIWDDRAVQVIPNAGITVQQALGLKDK
jgi:hypothetical protein